MTSEHLEQTKETEITPASSFKLAPCQEHPRYLKKYGQCQTYAPAAALALSFSPFLWLL